MRSGALHWTRFAPTSFADAYKVEADLVLHTHLVDTLQTNDLNDVSLVRLHDKLYIIKRYLKAKLSSKTSSMIRREVQIHGSLDHPNIVKLYGFWDSLDAIVLMFEYCDKKDLFHLIHEAQAPLASIKRKPGLGEHIARDIATQILQALEYMHSLDLIHRDLKTENIFVCHAPGDEHNERLIYKLGDFNFTINNVAERPSSVCGTRKMLSPEMLRMHRDNKRRKIGHRVSQSDPGAKEPETYGQEIDIFSFGILIYECITGAHPFPGGDTYEEILDAIEQGPYISRTLSPMAKDFVLRAIELDGSKRASASELLMHPWITEELPARTPGQSARQGGASKKKLLDSLFTPSKSSLVGRQDSADAATTHGAKKLGKSTSLRMPRAVQHATSPVNAPPRLAGGPSRLGLDPHGRGPQSRLMQGEVGSAPDGAGNTNPRGKMLKKVASMAVRQTLPEGSFSKSNRGRSPRLAPLDGRNSSSPRPFEDGRKSPLQKSSSQSFGRLSPPPLRLPSQTQGTLPASEPPSMFKTPVKSKHTTSSNSLKGAKSPRVAPEPHQSPASPSRPPALQVPQTPSSPMPLSPSQDATASQDSSNSHRGFFRRLFDVLSPRRSRSGHSRATVHPNQAGGKLHSSAGDRNSSPTQMQEGERTASPTPARPPVKKTSSRASIWQLFVRSPRPKAGLGHRKPSVTAPGLVNTVRA